MKKRIFVNLLAVLLLVMTMAPAAFALEDTHHADGTCGDGITWSLDGYTLTIDGSGEMEEGCPWIEYIDHVEHVVLKGGITKIGKEAFFKFKCIETVDFGDALVEIGERAFSGCDDLEYIHLPATFRTFGKEAFRDCTELKYVYCDGGMPRFNDSCLWTGNYISVFYPPNNPWPAEAVNQLVANFGGRLGVMMGSYENSELVPQETEEETEATEPETTAATEAPTEAATVPTTQPTVAVMVTEAPTVPTTAAPTEAPTEAPETTAVPTEAPTTAPATEAEPETVLTLDLDGETEPQTPVEKVGSDGWIGMVLIAGVLTFLIIGALVFKLLSGKGGRYKR